MFLNFSFLPVAGNLKYNYKHQVAMILPFPERSFNFDISFRLYHNTALQVNSVPYEPSASIFTAKVDPKEGDIRFIQYICNHIQEYKVSQQKRPQLEHSLL